MKLLIFLQTVNQWIHIISFAVWIGGILFFLFVFAPAAHSLPPRAGIDVLNQGRQSFQTLSWITINLLLLTGTFNFIIRSMAAGFMLGSSYHLILGIKLLLFLAMVLHHCFQAFKYAPRIVSLTAQTAEDIQSWPEPLASHWRRWFLLLKINAAFGPVILLLALGLTRI